MERKTKIRLLSAALLSALACSVHAESRLIDLNSGTFFEGVVSTKPLCTVSQDADGITVSYTFDYAVLSDNSDVAGTYTWGGEGLSVCTNPGEPAIVATRDIFNITNFADVNIELTGASYIDLPYELAPTPYPVIGTLETPPTDPIQPYAGFFPTEILHSSDGYNVRDGRYIDVDLCAIQYNYASQTIRAYKSVTYRITPKTSSAMLPQVMSCNDEPAEPIWLDEAMESVVSNPQSVTTPYITESTSPDLGLLLVTSKTLQSVTEEYAKYKRSIGIRTHTIVLENGGNTSTADVKQMISSKLAEDKSISYLLIVGDLTHVPAGRSLAINIANASEDPYRYNISDFLYVSADNTVSPVIKYGRIPLKNIQDIKTVFEKIKKYELTPPTNNAFYENMLFVSEFERETGNDTQTYIGKPEQYENDGTRFVEAAEYIAGVLKKSYGKNVTRQYHIDIKDASGRQYMSPKYYAKVDNVFDENGNIERILPSELLNLSFYNNSKGIMNLLNSGDGYGCFFYNAHGQVDKTESGYFSTASIDSLSNGNNTPVVLAVSCLLGRYDSENNFARKFLKHTNGGCVGIMAATNRIQTYIGNIFSNSMFDCIYPGTENCNFITEKHSTSHFLRMGAILDYSFKVIDVQLPWGTKTVVKDFVNQMHYFGDPTMRIRTSKPIRVSIPAVYVKKDAINGYRLTVYSTNGQEFSVCEDGQQPIRSLEGIFDMKISDPSKVKYTVCINGDNMIPYYRTLTAADVLPMNYKMSAKYIAATQTINVSFTPPVASITSRVYAWVEAYDSNGRYIGSTPHVTANGLSYDETISVSSFSFTGPYVLCLMLDGENIYTIKVA